MSAVRAESNHGEQAQRARTKDEGEKKEKKKKKPSVVVTSAGKKHSVTSKVGAASKPRRLLNASSLFVDASLRSSGTVHFLRSKSRYSLSRQPNAGGPRVQVLVCCVKIKMWGRQSNKHTKRSIVTRLHGETIALTAKPHE